MVRICVIGPMTGSNPGMVPTQGELIAHLLHQSGYPIISVSKHPNRYIRLMDIVWTLVSRQRHIDVQLLQVYSGRSFVVEDIASVLGILTRKKVIMMLHGGNLPHFARRFPRWVKRVLGRAACIITPSRYLARELAWLGLPMQIIPNILELSTYPYQHRSILKPNLLWMRAFYDYYNPEMALKVLALIQPYFPQAHLTLAGPDMGLLPQIRAQAEQMGLSSRVSFPGFLNTNGKLQAGGEHDIYLNTNRIDNMPVSVLEMAAMGLPVVSTNVGGIPDLLTDHENGLLVPSDDAQAMAVAIQSLLENPDLAGRLSANGRKLAESCAWENIAPQWENVFKTVLP